MLPVGLSSSFALLGMAYSTFTAKNRLSIFLKHVLGSQKLIGTLIFAGKLWS